MIIDERRIESGLVFVPRGFAGATREHLVVCRILSTFSSLGEQYFAFGINQIVVVVVVPDKNTENIAFVEH